MTGHRRSPRGKQIQWLVGGSGTALRYEYYYQRDLSFKETIPLLPILQIALTFWQDVTTNLATEDGNKIFGAVGQSIIIHRAFQKNGKEWSDYILVLVRYKYPCFGRTRLMVIEICRWLSVGSSWDIS